MAPLAPRHRATVPLAIVCAVVGLCVLGIIGLDPRPAQISFNDQIFGFLHWAELTPGYEWITFDLLERTGNILLFVPIGIVSHLVVPRRRWGLSLAIGPILSIGIELVQWLFLAGRTGSAGDVLVNSFGATIGVGLAALVSLPIAARRARRLDATLTPAPDFSRSPR